MTGRDVVDRETFVPRHSAAMDSVRTPRPLPNV
jgi:hypothetical protein